MLTANILKVAVSTAMADILNTATGATGKLRFYTGSAPTAPEDAPTGTLIAECPLQNPAWFFVAGDLISLFPTIQDTDTDAGTVGYGRIDDSSDNCLMQLTVGVSGDFRDVIFDNLTFALHDTLTMDSLSLFVDLSP